MATPTLLAAVRAHAMVNYENGWDFIVECFDDAELADYIAPATTLAQVIEAVAPVVEVYQERQADAASYYDPF